MSAPPRRSTHVLVPAGGDATRLVLAWPRRRAAMVFLPAGCGAALAAGTLDARVTGGMRADG
jgi:hypothetical protein